MGIDILRWIGTIALVIVISSLVEAPRRHWGIAAVVLASTFVFLGHFKYFNIWNWLINNPVGIFKYVSFYFLGALIWGVVYWAVKCQKHKMKFLKAKESFLKIQNSTEFTPELRLMWTQYATNEKSFRGYFSNIKSDRIYAKDYKETIISAMCLWPFSLFGCFFSDFILELGYRLYDMLSGLFDTISDKIFNGMESDFVSKEDLIKDRQNSRRDF